MIRGDAAVIRRSGTVYGRVLSCSGSQYRFVTPGGTVMRSGIVWCHPALPADLVELRRYEAMVALPYGRHLFGKARDAAS